MNPVYSNGTVDFADRTAILLSSPFVDSAAHSALAALSPAAAGVDVKSNRPAARILCPATAESLLCRLARIPIAQPNAVGY
jgi:hypothetical protein